MEGSAEMESWNRKARAWRAQSAHRKDLNLLHPAKGLRAADQ